MISWETKVVGKQGRNQRKGREGGFTQNTLYAFMNITYFKNEC